MQRKELKQKLRKLKKLELKLRYGYSMRFIDENISTGKLEELPLVWKEQFCLNEKSSNKARYSLNDLESMSAQELDRIFEEYWFYLYFQMYKEMGMQMMDLQDPELLTYLGLPYEADTVMIKKRFRELCKTYHPDAGGDKDKFIELLDMLEKHHVK